MTRSQRRKAWWFSLPAFFTDAIGQTTHTVTVGAQGSFYDPPTISAPLNDTVSFVFAGPLHSVVQADFDSPCFPKAGGFSSGLTGVESNQSTAPVWNLKISNDSQAIWFYCANTRPSPHCAAGMVGAINPPSIPVYNQYLAAAKQVTGFVPTTSPPVILTGVGGFATGSPAVPTLSTSSATTTTSASNSASSTSAFPSPTSSTSDDSSRESSSSSSSHKRAAIIGGVVGGIGGLVLLVLLFAYFMVCSSKRRRRRNSKDFFRYRAKSPAFERALDKYTPAASASNSAAGGGASDARAALLAGAANASNASSTGSPSGRSRATDLPSSVRSTPASSPAMSVPLQLSNRSGHAYAQAQAQQQQQRRPQPPSSSSTLPPQGVVTGSSPSAALRQLQHHPRSHQHYQASGKGGGGAVTSIAATATEGQDLGPTNIQALAKEVAAVLSQTAQQQPRKEEQQQQRQQEELPVKHDTAKGTPSPPSRMSELSGETPAPPKYQPS